MKMSQTFYKLKKTDVYINIFSLQTYSLLARFELFFLKIWSLALHLMCMIT